MEPRWGGEAPLLSKFWGHIIFLWANPKVVLERASCIHLSHRSTFLLKTVLDPWKDPFFLPLLDFPCDDRIVYPFQRLFLSISFHWLRPALFSLPLSLGPMTTILHNYYVTKLIPELTRFIPDDGSTAFLRNFIPTWKTTSCQNPRNLIDWIWFAWRILKVQLLVLLLDCWCATLSDKMLLTLASRVIRGSKPRCICDHILLFNGSGSVGNLCDFYNMIRLSAFWSSLF